jgi:hypothetical protein
MILTASLFQCPAEMGFLHSPFDYRIVNCDLCYQSVSVSNKIYFQNSENYERKLIEMFASRYIIPSTPGANASARQAEYDYRDGSRPLERPEKRQVHSSGLHIELSCSRHTKVQLRSRRAAIRRKCPVHLGLDK